MAKVRLTPTRIQDFACPDGKAQDFLWDAQTEGLGIRATVRGKMYVFQAKLRDTATGKRISIRIPIGSPRTWKLDEARDHARDLRREIDRGRDPRVIKAETTAADVAKRQQDLAEQSPALDAWNAYIDARATKWSDRHKNEHHRMSREGGQPITRGKREGMSDTKEPGILRPLLLLPLSDITRDEVADWLETEAAKRPTHTRLAVSMLATFLNWCANRPEYRDQVHGDACSKMKRELPRAQAKDDCLQREQLKLWFEKVRALPGKTHSAYLQCLLLTGARREEMAALKWSDVDFQWKSLTIRDKVEGTRTIGLTPYVASLLQGLKQRRDAPEKVTKIRKSEPDEDKKEPSPWVFASVNSKSGRITEPRIAHNKALSAAALPALSIHGLRRSFGTLAEWVECPAGISAQLMGHRPSATAEKHYRKRPLDLLRMWHAKIEGWILTEAGIEQPTEKEAEPIEAKTAA